MIDKEWELALVKGMMKELRLVYMGEIGWMGIGVNETEVIWEFEWVGRDMRMGVCKNW